MLQVEEHFKQVPPCLCTYITTHNQDSYNKKQSQNLRNSTMMNRNNLIRECNICR